MGRPLVIVESPAKARTIGKILGSDFQVEASIGHIRDLPQRGEIPEAIKGLPWARLGVDIENDFQPVYVVSSERKQRVKELKAALKSADALYLATDEDREGEAIAWHLVETLQPKVPVHRMVFHEITAKAIKEAASRPRELDLALVEAQETRRILDRLVGYEVSPVLWRRVRSGLSAGRVQSVAVRLVVQRERERMAFVTAEYHDLEATVAVEGGSFAATLVAVGAERVATSKDFGSDGALKNPAGIVIVDAARAASLAEGVRGQKLTVASVETKPYRRSPAAPFMTSTLQQEAARKLGFSAQRAMRAAQGLYENGFITYMRTDSVTLSAEAITAARAEATRRFGAASVPDAPRTYTSKVRNAQEAHEAIRPAGESFRDPSHVSTEVGADEAKLYDLVFKRTVASQMVDARGETVSARLSGTATDGTPVTFGAAGTTITDQGFRAVYIEGQDEPSEGDDDAAVLPPLREGQEGVATEVTAEAHSTKSPARYTEASLVRRLEELGIGRPSTYASILNTIVRERGYVWKKGQALVPSWTAFAVIALLERYFEHLVDHRFTARMEEDLDKIADGQASRVPYLRAFYDGDGTDGGLRALISDEHLATIDAREVNTIALGQDPEGRDINVRVGKYGPYLERGEDKANIAEDLEPDQLTIAAASQLLEAGGDDGRVLGTDPETGLDVRVRTGRYGPYVALGGSEGEKAVKYASLFSSMQPGEVTLEQGLELLSLPRTVGVDPESGVAIEALNGRYGPYVKRGTETRRLAAEEELLTVTVEQALEAFRQPPRRRGQGAPAAPLRELGTDPITSKALVVKEGRYGPYVTDGETHASIRRGESVEGMTLERASEMIAEKRAAGPSAKRGRGAARAAPKKATVKRAATKDAPAKKAPAKKPSGSKKPAAKKKAPGTE